MEKEKHWTTYLLRNDGSNLKPSHNVLDIGERIKACEEEITAMQHSLRSLESHATARALEYWTQAHIDDAKARAVSVAMNYAAYAHINPKR